MCVCVCVCICECVYVYEYQRLTLRTLFLSSIFWKLLIWHCHHSLFRKTLTLLSSFLLNDSNKQTLFSSLTNLPYGWIKLMPPSLYNYFRQSSSVYDVVAAILEFEFFVLSPRSTLIGSPLWVKKWLVLDKNLKPYNWCQTNDY